MVTESHASSTWSQSCGRGLWNTQISSSCKRSFPMDFQSLLLEEESNVIGPILIVHVHKNHWLSLDSLRKHDPKLWKDENVYKEREKAHPRVMCTCGQQELSPAENIWKCPEIVCWDAQLGSIYLLWTPTTLWSEVLKAPHFIFVCVTEWWCRLPQQSKKPRSRKQEIPGAADLICSPDISTWSQLPQQWWAKKNEGQEGVRQGYTGTLKWHCFPSYTKNMAGWLWDPETWVQSWGPLYFRRKQWVLLLSLLQNPWEGILKH
jgi:hypothetical protein